MSSILICPVSIPSPSSCYSVLTIHQAEKRDAIDGALGHKDVEAELNIEHELEENSPYPEVRAAVKATDEDVPANTIRAWILGMIFVTIGSGCNMLFSLRNPAIQITSIVAQLVSYPFGLMMAAWLPTRKFRTFRIEWTLNPGPFNIKEHALVTIMANVSFAQGAAYSTYSLESLIAFYKVDYGWGFALLFVSVLSDQSHETVADNIRRSPHSWSALV